MKLNTSINAQVIFFTSLLTFGITQNAIASSTIVTDAVGTKELWSFQEVLGAQRMTSRANLVDSKSITQTWDGNGNKLSRVDAEGQVMGYTYNATNQRTSMTEASGTPEARVTMYEYVSDDIDLITKISSPSIYGSNIKEVVNTYDDNQNIIDVTINGFAADGLAVTRNSTFTYDVYGKVTEVDGPRTDVTDITQIEYYDCDTGGQCGQLKKITNAAGHVTSYDAYDAAARLLQRTSPNGVVTTYTYHPRSWLLSMTHTPPTGAARVTTYGYDNVGQLTKITLPDGTIQNYVYDASHALRQITDNVGNKVTYQYDAKGNRTDEQTFDPNGTLVRSTITYYDIRNFIEKINDGGSVTELVNDAVGNLSTITDPNKNPETQHSFDGLYRLNNTIDALTNDTTYNYNVADQLSDVTAPNGALTSYEYDDLGNKTKEISADRGTTLYTHDDAGNVISMLDARGISTTYQYDVLNRLTRAYFPDVSERLKYQYDNSNCTFGVGRLCGVRDKAGFKAYNYDAWGNVVQLSWLASDGNDGSLGTFNTYYVYDAANRLIQVTYPSGREATITRDVIGRPINVDTEDANGNTQNIISGRTYRADGLWTTQSYGNGLSQTKQYDTQGRLLSHNAGNYSRDYAYDANGNIISADALDNSRERDYQYDVLDRLTHESDLIRSLIREYQYDANGNRESVSESSQFSPINYQIDSNRMTSDNGVGVTLDASGRTLTDGSGRSYSYYDSGRLKKISLGGQKVGQYAYDYQQLRALKLSDQILTLYHYDISGNLIAENDSQGTLIREYVYVDGERVAAIVPGEGVTPQTTTNTPSNLALGKVATQIDTANGSVAARAVDGITDGHYVNGSLANTLNRIQPWWQVDLKVNSEIESITLFNREDAATERLSDFYVFVSSQPFAQQSLDQLIADSSVTRFYHSGTLSNNSLTILTSGAQGRYVRLQLSGTDYLHFAEMQVMGTPTGTPSDVVNIAQGKSASQVSTYSGGAADRAIDGNTEPEFTQGSISFTGNVSQPWWQVDLGQQAAIDTVRVYQRIESNAPFSTRLSDFYVMLSPTPFGSRTLTSLLADPTIEHQYHAGSFTGPTFDFAMQNATGQYVRVQLSGTNFLELAEVEVLQQADLVVEQGVGDGAEEGGVHYYVNDHLMTPQLALNQNNDVTWQADYTAFGKTTISVEKFINNHRFPGQYADAESGLYYNWNRYYDSEVGRYVTSDPIGLDGGLNTYGYVGGNPNKYVDQRGLDCVYTTAAGTMVCTDAQGQITHDSTGWVSGQGGRCQNNPSPACTSQRNIGPIPAGEYTSTGVPAHRQGTATTRRNLTPNPNNNMQNRSDFQTHYCPNTATCSNGCPSQPDWQTLQDWNNYLLNNLNEPIIVQ